MSFNDKDYQAFADAIVQDYVRGSIPLRESLVKVAHEHGLNVHETRRLLETTNVHAHLTLFKQASDKKYIEFDVIDPADVCNELFGVVDSGGSSSQEKVASVEDLYMELPDEHFISRQSQLEKVASESVPDVEPLDRSDFGAVRDFYTLSKVNKIASELHNEVLEAFYDFSEKVEKVAEDLRSIYAPPFPSFEKDAYALLGKEAAPVLKAVAGELGVEAAREKVANHYVSETPALRKLSSAVHSYKDLQTKLHAHQWFKEKADPLLF